jgi:uncharacterized membrane protein YhaH (DUF805 family)
VQFSANRTNRRKAALGGCVLLIDHAPDLNDAAAGTTATPENCYIATMAGHRGSIPMHAFDYKRPIGRLPFFLAQTALLLSAVAATVAIIIPIAVLFFERKWLAAIDYTANVVHIADAIIWFLWAIVAIILVSRRLSDLERPRIYAIPVVVVPALLVILGRDTSLHAVTYLASFVAITSLISLSLIPGRLDAVVGNGGRSSS